MNREDHSTGTPWETHRGLRHKPFRIPKFVWSIFSGNSRRLNLISRDDACASYRTRTYNPLIKSQLLCQLS